MYVKLTKPDNSPIWINSAFVVTVEPRRGGGAVVVPIGDGLDYDVRESPEAVLAMLEGAPVPAVVPVPVPKSLAPLSHYALPEGASGKPQMPAQETPKPAPPAVKPPAEDAKPAEKAADAEEPPAETPKKKTRGRVSKKKAAEEAAAESAPAETPAEAAAPAEPAPAEAEPETPAKPKRARGKRKTPIDLTDEQLLRLRRMVPGTIRKLANTLATQFHVEDPETTIRALDEHAIISFDRERVIWSAMQ